MVVDTNNNVQWAIQKLKSDKLSVAKIIKFGRIVVKSLNSYLKDKEYLPPQTLIPCCLFLLPTKLFQILGCKPQEFLTTPPTKLSQQLLLKLYLNLMPQLLQNSENQIKHVIVQGMNQSILLSGAYGRIARRWLRILINLWGNSSQNINLCLRCYLTISKYSQHCNQQSYMWIIRNMYLVYLNCCKHPSYKNIQHLNLMINSYCEMVKINIYYAYYVIFGYLKSISMKINQFYQLKRTEKKNILQKLYSNPILYSFKLFTTIICRVQSQQLSALVYPLVELMCAYEKLSEGIQHIPLKLHILSYNLQIMQNMGIYIPLCASLGCRLLSCSIFHHKMTKNAQSVDCQIQFAYRLSKDDLSNTLTVNELFNTIIRSLYHFHTIAIKNIAGYEIIIRMLTKLKNIEFNFITYNKQLKQLIKYCKQDSKELYQMRSQYYMQINEGDKIHQFEQILQNHKEFQTLKKHQILSKQYQTRVKRRLSAENPSEEEQIQYNQQELNQDNYGWSQHQSAASSFIEDESESNINDNSDDISYSGDPDDPSEAINQWSQHSWSSQQQNM